MRRNQRLSNREIDILMILWNNSVSMTASEVVKTDETLTMNTVQAVLRKLLKENYIEVAEIVYSGTVLTRSYRPKVSREEFALQEMKTDYMTYGKNMDKSLLVASLLDSEADTEKAMEEINQLEKMLEAYKKTIGQRKKED